ncbi:hypothetical protein D9M68_425730 [compost metagenome]
MSKDKKSKPTIYSPPDDPLGIDPDKDFNAEVRRIARDAIVGRHQEAVREEVDRALRRWGDLNLSEICHCGRKSGAGARKCEISSHHPPPASKLSDTVSLGIRLDAPCCRVHVPYSFAHCKSKTQGMPLLLAHCTRDLIGKRFDKV